MAAQAPSDSARPQASTALYVGNLSPEVLEAHLLDKFSAVGPVASVRVCRDSVSRRSLGYAYVNFINTEHAKVAIDTLNAEPLMERAMRVMYSMRDPAQRRSGVGNIFIRNLAKDIDTKALLDTMSQFGTVVSVKIASDQRTGVSRGYGFVQFSTDQEARAAIAKLDGMTLEGQVISVVPYKTKQERTQEQERNFTNVFVKNLPTTFDDDKLKELFGQFGEISRHTVRRNESGTSKGYGFVEFKLHESAKAAVDKLNSFHVDDEHLLVVERAQKKSERQENLKRGVTRVDRQNQNNLYVKNIDDTVTDDKLRELFGPFGNIKSIRIARDDTGRSKGFGFVSFDTQEAATKAATELNCKFVGSKPLYVAKFQNRQERSQHLQMIFRQPAMTMPTGMAPYPYAGYNPMMMPPFQPTGGYPGGPTNRRGPPMGGMPGQRYGPRPQQGAYGAYGGAYQPNMGAPRNQQPRPGGMMGAPGGGMPRGGGPGAPGSFGAAGGPKPSMGAAMPTPQPAGQRRDELSASALASLAPDAQRHTIGERLYHKIAARHGGKAGKITGMLLEMDISELLHLMEDDEALMVKEKEALKVLNEHKS